MAAAGALFAGHAQAGTAADAAAAIDAFFKRPDLRYDGAVAVVVADGKTVFSQGYGFEDGALAKTPVDPAATRFEVASITKTFIGTSIAQLVEAGRIASVDDAANKYLKGWQLPDNAGKPITLRHLLTHQAGFAEMEAHDFVPGSALPVGDAAYFQRKLPAFIGPAGVRSNYSNYGLGVLGRVIADGTGKPVHDALAETIWKPLNMTATAGKLAFGEPPRRIAATAFYPDGSRVPLPAGAVADPVITSGAGGTLSTGADMARYMTALLGGSAEAGIPALLSEATRQWMFSRLGQNDPISQGYGAAFMVNRWNGSTIVEHGGRGLAAQSVMLLLPEQRVGIFLSVSGEGGAPSGSDLLLQLIGKGRMVPTPGAERFRTPNLFTMRAPPLVAMLGWPQAPDVAGLAPAAAADLAAFAGTYESERRLPGSRQRWVDWFIKGATVNVGPDGKGGLRVGWADGYKPIAKDVFWREPPQDPKRLVGWNELVVFERSASGAVERLWFGYTDATFGRMAGDGTPGTVLAVLPWAALVLLTGVLALAWRRATPGRAVALVLPLLLLALPVGFFGFWPDALPAPFNILFIGREHLAPFVVVGNAIVLAGLWLVWRLFAAAPEGTPRWRSVLQRVHGGLLAAGALAMGWVLTVLNGTGWPL